MQHKYLKDFDSVVAGDSPAIQLLVVTSLHQRIRTPDHLMQGSPSSHHRINGVFFLHLEVNQHRPLMFASSLNRRNNLTPTFHRVALNAISLTQLHKVRTDERRSLIILVTENFLPLAHHPQKSIVDDGDVDLDFFLNDGGKLTHSHLKSAITRHNPNFSFRTRDFRTNPRWQSKPHSPQPTRGNQRPRSLMLVILRSEERRVGKECRSRW